MHIIDTEMMEAPVGYHYEPEYTEENDEIVRTWVLVADPEPSDEISADEALAIIMGGAV